MIVDIKKNKKIGDHQPAFIIAEIGSNHNNNLKTAYKLIDKSVEAGADAVKFQIYSAETLYSKYVPKHSDYNSNLWELIKKIETPREWIPELKEYCDQHEIIFFATPFDRIAVDEMEEVDADLYKIASFEIVDLDLIKYVSRKGKPTIISTGLSNMEEIEDAYHAFTGTGNKNLIFLQCASLYPATPDIMNLRAMNTIKNAFSVPVGLSDHTPGINISLAAVALGASVIEKHITLSRKMDGPDHPFAIEPEELKMLVAQSREIESALGDGRKLGPSKSELEYYNKARRSLHANRDISKGEKISPDMLISKRPGYGIKPKYIDYILDRKAKTDIKKDNWITLDMLE